MADEAAPADLAPAPAALVPPPLARVPTTPEASERASKAGATLILSAIAIVEKVTQVDDHVLDALGVGFDQGNTFSDCDSMSEKTAWLQEYTKALCLADYGAFKSIPVPASLTETDDRKQARVTTVLRMLRGLVDPKITVAAGASAVPRITVVAKTEDENAYSYDFPGTELELQQAQCAELYARAFDPLFVPKMAVLKRICYCVKIDKRMAPLARISLSSMRLSPNDTSFILLKRWCVGHVIIAVGAAPPPGFVSAGYGIAGHTVEWLSWWDCLDLLDTLETRLVALNEAARTSVIESLIEIISASSGHGNPRVTASCAVGRAVHDAIRIIAAAAASEAGGTSTKRKGDDGADEPKLGPNGLARLKGGNPAGELCRNFAKGRCPRDKCSFSHAKPAASAPAAAEEE